MSKEIIFVRLPRGQMAKLIKAIGNSKKNCYGYELAKQEKIPLNGVYTVLYRLEKEAFIVGMTEPNPRDGQVIPRRNYKLTEIGQKAYEVLMSKGE